MSPCTLFVFYPIHRADQLTVERPRRHSFLSSQLGGFTRDEASDALFSSVHIQGLLFLLHRSDACASQLKTFIDSTPCAVS